MSPEVHAPDRRDPGRGYASARIRLQPAPELACVGAGSLDQALAESLDVAQRTYEANVLLNAASLITRIAKEA